MCLFVSRLLGALCCCICDPSVNTVAQEIKPAESLAQLLLFHLNSKSALQRFSVALVICEWAALQKVGYLLQFKSVFHNSMVFFVSS